MNKIVLIALTAMLLLTACQQQESTEELTVGKLPVEEKAMATESLELIAPEINAVTEITDDLSETDQLVRDAVLRFGANEYDENGRRFIQVSSLSMYYNDSWNLASSTPMDMFAFFHHNKNMEGLSYEELGEKYKHPDQNSERWFYPQNLYEETVMSYFDVTRDFLRSDEHIYLPEFGGYTMPDGGGVGYRPTIDIGEFYEDGDCIFIQLYLSTMDGGIEPYILTLQTDSEGYKYLSYLPGRLTETLQSVNIPVQDKSGIIEGQTMELTMELPDQCVEQDGNYYYADGRKAIELLRVELLGDDSLDWEDLWISPAVVEQYSFEINGRTVFVGAVRPGFLTKPAKDEKISYSYEVAMKLENAYLCFNFYPQQNAEQPANGLEELKEFLNSISITE